MDIFDNVGQDFTNTGFPDGFTCAIKTPPDRTRRGPDPMEFQILALRRREFCFSGLLIGKNSPLRAVPPARSAVYGFLWISWLIVRNLKIRSEI